MSTAAGSLSMKPAREPPVAEVAAGKAAIAVALAVLAATVVTIDLL
jgi:hypothetical protein